MSKTRFQFASSIIDAISTRDDLYEKYFYPLIDDADKRFGSASVPLNQMMVTYAQQLAEYGVCFTEPFVYNNGTDVTDVIEIASILQHHSDNWGRMFQRVTIDVNQKMKYRCLAQIRVLVSRDDSYELHQYYVGKDSDRNSPYYQWEEIYRYLYYNPDKAPYVAAGVTDIPAIERCFASDIDPQIAAAMFGKSR